MAAQDQGIKVFSRQQSRASNDLEREVIEFKIQVEKKYHASKLNSNYRFPFELETSSGSDETVNIYNLNDQNLLETNDQSDNQVGLEADGKRGRRQPINLSNIEMKFKASNANKKFKFPFEFEADSGNDIELESLRDTTFYNVNKNKKDKTLEMDDDYQYLQIRRRYQTENDEEEVQSKKDLNQETDFKKQLVQAAKKSPFKFTFPNKQIYTATINLNLLNLKKLAQQVKSSREQSSYNENCLSERGANQRSIISTLKMRQNNNSFKLIKQKKQHHPFDIKFYSKIQ